MAHVLKIKSASVGALVDHYERNREGTLYRENIDASRTSLNYNLCPNDVQERVRMAKLRHEEVAGKAVRSDANVLIDWVVTLPKDCRQEDAQKFFKACLDFLGNRYGSGNVLGGYVHMDEQTPHVHVPVVPVIGGKLQASKMVDRADLRTFHGELGEHVDRALGYHVSVELDAEQHLEKAMSKLDQGEYKLAATRLESLQRETKAAERDVDRLESEVAAIEIQPAAPSIGENLGTIASSRGLGERERAAAEESERLGSRVAELERGVAEARSRCEGLRGRIESARSRIQEIAASLGHSVIKVNIAEGRRRILDILARHGVVYSAMIDRKRTGGSLEDAMRRAEEASKAMNRDRGYRSRPGRGMER